MKYIKLYVSIMYCFNILTKNSFVKKIKGVMYKMYKASVLMAGLITWVVFSLPLDSGIDVVLSLNAVWSSRPWLLSVSSVGADDRATEMGKLESKQIVTIALSKFFPQN